MGRRSVSTPTRRRASDPGTDDRRPTSASERLLAWILAGFLLLALGWAYARVDDAVRETGGGGRLGAAESQLSDLSRARDERITAIGLYGARSRYRVQDTARAARRRAASRDTARERYRTALDAGRPAGELRRLYLRADRQADAANAASRGARARYRAAREELAGYDAGRAATVQALERLTGELRASQDGWIFLWRATLSLGGLLLGFVLLRGVTQRAPAATPLAQALVGAAALLALFQVVDYAGLSLDFESVGPLGLALLGAALTVGAFAALQRYLGRHRPQRRIRAHECAACGHPAETSSFCEGCGAPVHADCHACGSTRRLGTPHCAACGAA